MAYDARLWQTKLAQIKSAGLYRDKHVLDQAQSESIQIGDVSYLNFASNDYLGLASSGDIVRAASDALAEYGLGSGASHMVIGHNIEHENLERDLARFTSRDRALVFSTGYMANLAVVSALCGSKSLILQDKLNHASLIDGARLSGARSQRYLHNDPESLAGYLRKFTSKEKYDQILVLTDGVFSMDGDYADLPALSAVCDEYGATLVVDDAHGIGVLGKSGAGCLEYFDMCQDECPALVGTFGKAFGSFGAFVAGPRDLIDYIEQVARPYIYTTAMPPALAAATRKSLELVVKASAERQHLRALASQFQESMAANGIKTLPSTTAIQAVVLGQNERAMQIAGYLKDNGFLVGAIRPPTVPAGQARLRVTLSAQHTKKQLEALISAIVEAVSLFGAD
jgi:8-amino-7-oxononanoate synthase